MGQCSSKPRTYRTSAAACCHKKEQAESSHQTEFTHDAKPFRAEARRRELQQLRGCSAVLILEKAASLPTHASRVCGPYAFSSSTSTLQVAAATPSTLQLMGTRNIAEYARLMYNVAACDPQLSQELEQAATAAWASTSSTSGVEAHDDHPTAEPYTSAILACYPASGGQAQSRLLALTIESGIWQVDGQPCPAVIVRHMPVLKPSTLAEGEGFFSEAKVQPEQQLQHQACPSLGQGQNSTDMLSNTLACRLARMMAVLEYSPMQLTLCSADGQVLYQNSSSLAYAGCWSLPGAKTTNFATALLSLQPELLEGLLETVIVGQEPWTRVVQVPPNLAALAPLQASCSSALLTQTADLRRNSTASGSHAEQHLKSASDSSTGQQLKPASDSSTGQQPKSATGSSTGQLLEPALGTDMQSLLDSVLVPDDRRAAFGRAATSTCAQLPSHRELGGGGVVSGSRARRALRRASTSWLTQTLEPDTIKAVVPVDKHTVAHMDDHTVVHMDDHSVMPMDKHTVVPMDKHTVVPMDEHTVISSLNSALDTQRDGLQSGPSIEGTTYQLQHGQYKDGAGLSSISTSEANSGPQVLSDTRLAGSMKHKQVCGDDVQGFRVSESSVVGQVDLSASLYSSNSIVAVRQQSSTKPVVSALTATRSSSFIGAQRQPSTSSPRHRLMMLLESSDRHGKLTQKAADNSMQYGSAPSNVVPHRLSTTAMHDPGNAADRMPADARVQDLVTDLVSTAEHRGLVAVREGSEDLVTKAAVVSAPDQAQPALTESMQSKCTTSPVEEKAVWHEVACIPFQDPETNQQVMLIAQTDVTERSTLEQKLMNVTEGWMYMLENMFPKHILERIACSAAQQHAARQEGDASDNMLHLVKELQQGATHHECVTIMFTDVCGFTAMSKEVQPEQVMSFLNQLFSLFDDLVDKHKVYKVETAGDCYIVCAGLLVEDENGFRTLAADDKASSRTRAARRVLNFAMEMMHVAKTVLMPNNGSPVQQRVGVHSGPVVSGLIGHLLPKFALFGDTMNTASRMESTSRPGRIQISASTYALLQDNAPEHWEATGGVQVKGKGLMETHLLAEAFMGGSTQVNHRELGTTLLDTLFTSSDLLPKLRYGMVVSEPHYDTAAHWEPLFQEPAQSSEPGALPPNRASTAWQPPPRISSYSLALNSIPEDIYVVRATPTTLAVPAVQAAWKDLYSNVGERVSAPSQQQRKSHLAATPRSGTLVEPNFHALQTAPAISCKQGSAAGSNRPSPGDAMTTHGLLQRESLQDGYGEGPSSTTSITSQATRQQAHGSRSSSKRGHDAFLHLLQEYKPRMSLQGR